MVSQFPTPLRRGSRILIVGCGDVGVRLATLLMPRFQVMGTTRSASGADRLRQHGIRPIVLDLDLNPVRALHLHAAVVIHLAPPQPDGLLDLRTRRLVTALRGVRQMVYASTSGVYGDCDGAWISETRPIAPASDRARRRADSETVLRRFARASAVRLSILRVPGIYARERLPEARLRSNTPVATAAADVYTNHIHADDLARIIVTTLQRGRSMRVYHASDDKPLPVGEYFDQVAAALGVAPPPRLERDALMQQLTPMQRSFMQESRRLRNLRLHQELRFVLRYPEVATLLGQEANSLQ